VIAIAHANRMRGPRTVRPARRFGPVAAASIVLAAGCQSASSRIDPVYDSTTGRLQLLKADANGNGKPDTWSYMDGLVILRVEIDSNEDGRIDRWEYYDRNQRLEKIGTSSLDDGLEDTWVYPSDDGSADRTDISTKRDGKPNRTEFYENRLLVRAEEDSDGDGRPDRWETYQAGRLTSLAFDTMRRGIPDRRIVYDASGSARLETTAGGTEQPAGVNRPPR
jgi:hypothetical protein